MIKRRLLLKHSVVGAMTWLAGGDIANPSAAFATHDGFNQITDAYPSQIGFSQTYPTTYDGWSKAFLAGNGKRGIMVFGKAHYVRINCMVRATQYGFSIKELEVFAPGISEGLAMLLGRRERGRYFNSIGSL